MNLGFLLLAAVAASQVKVSFEDKILAKAPEEVTIIGVAFSADGRHVAFFGGGGSRTVVDPGRRRSQPRSAA